MEFAAAPMPGDLEADYRAAGFHTDVVIPRLLQKNVTEFGRSTAVIDDTRDVTWAELADAAGRVAGLLAAHGIGPGDTVVWQLPNWWEAIGGRPRHLGRGGDLGPGRADLPRARAGDDHRRRPAEGDHRAARLPRPRPRRHARRRCRNGRGHARPAGRRAR